MASIEIVQKRTSFFRRTNERRKSLDFLYGPVSIPLAGASLTMWKLETGAIALSLHSTEKEQVVWEEVLTSEKPVITLPTRGTRTTIKLLVPQIETATARESELASESI